jgi:hypothetical protein
MTFLKLLGPALLYLVSTAHAATTTFEQPPVLNATDLLGAEAVNGAHYQIAQAVPNNGSMNSFHLVSDIQTLDVISDDLALERAHEIDTIVALRKIKQTDAYNKGLEVASEAPLTLTKSVIEDPLGTLEKLPKGLNNLLNDLGATVSGIGRGNDTDKEDNAMVKDLLGFNTVKRRLAAEMLVDPYSSNPVLQKELNDVAWAMFAGGAPIDVALMAAPAVVSVAAKALHRLDGGQLDWNIPPATLRQAMDQQVQTLGLTPEESEQLVYHKHCSLRHQSVLISAMLDLKDVSGRAAFLRRAMTATNEMACRQYQQMAELIWSYHRHIRRVTSVRMDNDLLWLDDSTQHHVLVNNADYLPWTEANAAVFNTLPADKAYTVWMSGRLSAQTVAVLQQRHVVTYQQVNRQYPNYVRVTAVLLPGRVATEPPGAQGNKTGELVDDVTTGVGDLVGGVLGGLGLSEGQQNKQQNNEPNNENEDAGQQAQ